jgi:lauroyl/myristoyl acyltransferase
MPLLFQGNCFAKQQWVIFLSTNLSSILQWRSNVFIFQKLGWRMAFYYITILRVLYFTFVRKEKQKTKMAVLDVFAGRKSTGEIECIIRRVFRGMSSHYYEKLFNAYSSAETLRAFLRTHMENEGMSAIDEGLSKGRGVLLITGHFGGVEFIPGYLAANHYPVTIVVKFSSNHLRKVSTQKAEKFSARLIDPANTPNMIRSILDNLRENRIVIIQCDEIAAWSPSHDTKIDFLGKQINLDKTLNILTKRGNCPIVFGIMHRMNQHRYKFIVNSWEEMSKQFLCSGEMSIGAVVLKLLEHYIYKYPQQWYQWQKCAEIKTVVFRRAGVDGPASLPSLKSSLGKAA